MRKKLTLNLVALFAVAAVLIHVWQLPSLHAQASSYSNITACTLTSNPPIAGRMVDGVCKPFLVYESPGLLIGGDIMVSPAPTKCPAGTEKVLVPGGVKCARGLVDPE